MTNLGCDGCGTSDLRGAWSYPCEDFTMIGPVEPGSRYAEFGLEFGFTGGWLLCASCAVAYEERGPEGLTERALSSGRYEEAGLAAPDDLREEIARRLGVLHEEFHMRRTGPRERYEPVARGEFAMFDAGRRYDAAGDNEPG